MNINLACAHILSQLTDLVAQIHESDFTKPSDQLSQSTIGQHLRHTLEFFICFESGYQHGVINYDKRAHDKQIERYKYIALATIGRIEAFVKSFKEKELNLEVGYDLSQD